MAIASLSGSPATEGGPSVAATKRIAKFSDTSDDDDEQENVGFSGGRQRSNGFGTSSKVNGSVKKKRVTVDERSNDARQARKLEAEKLFVTRQELPFYQGESRCQVGDILGLWTDGWDQGDK